MIPGRHQPSKGRKGIFWRFGNPANVNGRPPETCRLRIPKSLDQVGRHKIAFPADERRAGQHRHHEITVGVGKTKRYPGVQAVILGEIQRFQYRQGVGPDVPVRKADGLGLSGRTAGEQDRRQIRVFPGDRLRPRPGGRGIAGRQGQKIRRRRFEGLAPRHQNRPGFRQRGGVIEGERVVYGCVNGPLTPYGEYVDPEIAPAIIGNEHAVIRGDAVFGKLILTGRDPAQ